MNEPKRDDEDDSHSRCSADQLARECETLRQRVCQLESSLADLRQSESKYRELVEDSCSVVLRMDVHGNVTFANHHALSFFGFSEKELLGKHVVGTIVPFVERSGRDLAELIHDICEHPDRYQDNENENIQQDGTRRWIAWTNKGIRDEEGRPREILCIGNDITDRKRAEETLLQEQQTLRHLLESQQHDLKLVAYEIHDGLSQFLTAATMQFQAFERMKDDTEAARETYRAGRENLDQAVLEARRLIADLRPPVLEESGIVEAIRQLIDKQDNGATPKAEFVCDTQFDRLDSLPENALFRIVQEGLNNAARHSGSDKVRITLRQRDGRVTLDIRDWGSGFDMSAVGVDRFGLKGICERARILGGEASIESALGQGTQITVQLPMTLGVEK